MIQTDLETWLLDFNEEKIFRIYRRKDVFTPYEQEKKFMDETVWECVSESAKIVEAIELPNKDMLFGFRDLYEDDSGLIESACITYYMLSQIQLEDITEIINDKIE